LITNKSLIVASSWSHLYLLFKDARSFEYKVYQVFHSEKINLKTLSDSVIVRKSQYCLDRPEKRIKRCCSKNSTVAWST